MSLEEWDAAIGSELRECMATLRTWEKVFKKQDPDGETAIRHAFDTLAVAPMKEWLKTYAETLLTEAKKEFRRRIHANMDLINKKVTEERHYMFFEYTDELHAKSTEWQAAAEQLITDRTMTNFLHFDQLTQEFAAMFDSLKPYDVHISVAGNSVLVVQTPAQEN